MKIIITSLMIMLFLAVTVYCQTQNTELKIFKVRHVRAEYLYEIMNSLKSNEGKISVDPNTNSIIVTDYPDNLQNMAIVLDSVDMPPRQVEIKVIVTEASEEFFNSIGINSAEVIIPSGRLRGVMDLFKRGNNTLIRSEMKVVTLSSNPARFQVSTDELFSKTTVIYPEVIVVNSVEKRPVGEFLEVLPIVNSDGTILVTLSPSVSNIRRRGAITERTIFTQVSVNNGDTIVIGGADTSSESTEEGLAVARTGQKRRTVMFLTATVIE